VDTQAKHKKGEKLAHQCDLRGQLGGDEKRLMLSKKSSVDKFEVKRRAQALAFAEAFVVEHHPGLAAVQELLNATETYEQPRAQCQRRQLNPWAENGEEVLPMLRSGTVSHASK
jgi:hypothetical protein